MAAAEGKAVEARRAGILVRSVSMRGLRGIAEGELSGLSGITVLVGPNNSGKSTVLEALYLAASGCGYDLIGRWALKYVLVRRGWFGISTAAWLFFDGQESCDVVLHMEDGSHVELKLRLEFPEAEDLSILRSRGLDVGRLVSITSSVGGVFTREFTHYMDESGQYNVLQKSASGSPMETLLLDWGAVASYGQPEECYSLMMRSSGVEAKNLVLSVVGRRYGIKDLQPLKERDRWVLYVVHEEHSIPIYLMGDGLRLALAYLMLLSVASDALLLLEEPELHQHPGLLGLVAEAIVRSHAQRRCQVVLSTHSLELIDLLIEKAEKLGVLDRLTVHRLSLEQGKLRSMSYSAREARELREELEMDLRR